MYTYFDFRTIRNNKACFSREGLDSLRLRIPLQVCVPAELVSGSLGGLQVVRCFPQAPDYEYRTPPFQGASTVRQCLSLAVEHMGVNSAFSIYHVPLGTLLDFSEF